MTDTPVVADIYLRISRARDGSELGVERQDPPCRTLLTQLGWTLGKVITDNDTSAFDGTPRKGYAELLDRQKRGLANGIVALDTDRLTRQPRDNEDLIDLAQQGTRIATVTGNEFDFSLLDEQLTFRLKGILAWRESQQKRLRAQMKHDELGRAGKFSGNRRGFGYDLVGLPIEVTRPDGTTVTHLRFCRLVPRDQEASEIRAAAQKLLGGGTLSAVMADWNRRGVARPEGGGRWTTRNIRRVMVNPRIAGLRQWRGQLVQPQGGDAWEPIISRDDWERLCLILANPAPHPQRGRRGPLPTRYLLTGRLGVCQCQVPIQAHGKHGVRYYRCDSGQATNACGRIHRLAEPVEDFVRDTVLLAFGDPDRGGKLRRALERTQNDDGALQALLAEKRAAAAKLARLEQEHIADVITDEQFERMNPLALERLAKAEAALKVRPVTTGLPVGIPEDLDAVKAAWQEWTIDERRAVVALAVKQVIFKWGARGKKFHPSQIALDWRV
jgi:DNA invertase Pin-like site-specific DNA recombinase